MTLAELNLAETGSQDFYDISLVDGFDLAISFDPQVRSGDLRSTSYSSNINAVCPWKLAVQGSDGSVAGCKSAFFVAFNQPQYYCTCSFFHRIFACRRTIQRYLGMTVLKLTAIVTTIRQTRLLVLVVLFTLSLSVLDKLYLYYMISL